MIILVTGGSGSGKSAFAEDCLTQLGADNRVYVATMRCDGNAETDVRIKRHQKMRADKQFTTVECPDHLEHQQFAPDSNMLLECASNLLANEWFVPCRVDPVVRITQAIATMQVKHLVVVTNEVFSDAVCYDSDTTAYLEALGALNRQFASMADVVYEVVYGIPILIKGVALDVDTKFENRVCDVQ